MLTDDLRRVRQNPGPLLFTVTVGLLIGIVVGLVVYRGDDRAKAQRVDGSQLVETAPPGAQASEAEDKKASHRSQSTRQSSGSRPSRKRVAAALRRGVAAAGKLGGDAGAAAWAADWSKPVIVGAAGRSMPMWSVAKPVTAVATLLAVAQKGLKPSAALSKAMERAITRSENCAESRIVLGLQTLAGRGAAGTRDRFERVLAVSGARSVPATQIAPPDNSCSSYLRQTVDGIDPSQSMPRLGTTMWKLPAAVSFAHALATGVYRAAGKRVLTLMAIPKKRSEEAGAVDTTKIPGWGAGVAFHGLRPAYKSGWGGAANPARPFQASQIVVVNTTNGPVALAAMFHPRTEPPEDDPGKTAAPQAFETIFRAVRPALVPSSG